LLTSADSNCKCTSQKSYSPRPFGPVFFFYQYDRMFGDKFKIKFEWEHDEKV
jgi:hypothetical protein